MYKPNNSYTLPLASPRRAVRTLQTIHQTNTYRTHTKNFNFNLPQTTHYMWDPTYPLPHKLTVITSVTSFISSPTDLSVRPWLIASGSYGMAESGHPSRTNRSPHPDSSYLTPPSNSRIYSFGKGNYRQIRDGSPPAQ